MNRDFIRRNPGGLLPFPARAHHARPDPGACGFEPLTDEEIQQAREDAGFPRSGSFNFRGLGQNGHGKRARHRSTRLAPWTDKRSFRGWKLGKPDPPEDVP